MNTRLLNITQVAVMLLMVVTLIVSCSSPNAPNIPDTPDTPDNPKGRFDDWEVKPVVDENQPNMAMLTATDKDKDGYVSFGISVNCKENNRDSVWIDLDNNGIYESGKDAKVTEFAKRVNYKASSQVITVYGRLTELRCHSNNLTRLDVSRNETLEVLLCYINQLDTLDIDRNVELKYLECYENRLTALNISHNTKLAFLWCRQNKLSRLDVSKNNNLRMLNVILNRIDKEAMKALVDGLPAWEEEEEGENAAQIVLEDKSDGTAEQNKVTDEIIKTAQVKNWVASYKGNDGYNHAYPPKK